jgi:S1-C subfamily serine protease
MKNTKKNVLIISALFASAISFDCWSETAEALRIAPQKYLQSKFPLDGGKKPDSNRLELKIDASHIYNFAAQESSLKQVSSEIKIQPTSKTRGAKETAVFDQIAQGTVLIATQDGLGSGVLITEKGHIVTNYHVVGDNELVNVFFRPLAGSETLQKKDAFLGKVIKVNVFKDLALVKIENVPRAARAVALANTSPKVGEDAHAVGHPKSEYWTYTKGYVSAVRAKYQWSASEKDVLKEAKIVQTQTPINPGNSGGPLVNDKKQLIGINSFTQPSSPGLNYAVAVEDVKEFLNQEGSLRPANPAGANKAQGACKQVELAEGEDKDDDGKFKYVLYDAFCTGKANAMLKIPLDQTKSIKFLFDTNADGKFDIVILDFDRDLKWDVSYHDTNFDGKPDVIGKHPEGNLVPTSFEPITG